MQRTILDNQHNPEKDRIGQAFALASAEKPAYADLYPFLETLFLLRADGKSAARPEPFELSAEHARARWEGSFPLLRRWEFPLDTEAAESLLEMIAGSLPEDNVQLKGAHVSLSRALANHPEERTAIWRSFLQHEMEPWEEWLDVAGVDTASLLFLARNCLRPSVELVAEDLLQRFPIPKEWLKGYCPVCGSLPSLLFLQKDGQRNGYCSWCGTSWGLNRLQCCYCDNRFHESLGYLYAEAETHYHIQYCNLCKYYFKLVLTGELLYPPYLPLEEWTTLHLDLLAQRAGFKQPPSPSPVVYGDAPA